MRSGRIRCLLQSQLTTGGYLMSEDLFLKIIEREIPADIVYETEEVLAFRDINPQAPVHVLIIPKAHIRTVNGIEQDQAELIGKLYLAAKEIARNENLADEGYRLVMNCNRAAGQLVFHIHLHLSACVCFV